MLWREDRLVDWTQLSTLVTQHFGLRGKQENCNSRNEHFKSAKNENGPAYVMSSCRVKPHEDEIISYKASRKGRLSKNGGD